MSAATFRSEENRNKVGAVESSTVDSKLLTFLSW